MKTYERGYNEGAEDAQIWYYCNICGEKIHIEPNSENHKALIEYMEEHGWGHASCHGNVLARAKQFHLYGLRAKINFRSLLKCLTYRNGRKVVTEAEFQEFLELADYMNFNFNPI